jgi:hypothetical protein
MNPPLGDVTSATRRWTFGYDEAARVRARRPGMAGVDEAASAGPSGRP